uniref:Uncharacterized protein n=1 Tax=Rhizophora mucronata TaxID=61149 RepID=A0A2P2LDR7_RHIMU
MRENSLLVEEFLKS